MSGPTLLQEAEAYLSARGILPDTAAKYGAVLEVSPTVEQLRTRLNQDFNGDRPECVLWFDAGWSRDGEGWVPNTWICRLFPPALRGGEPCKFLNAADREQRPYILPPSWEQAHNLLESVVVAEGPTRSLLLTQNGFCVISVAGVWNVTAKRTATEEQQNAKFKVHADFRRWAWNGRRVLLAYDQDYRVNETVLGATIRNVVLFSALGAEVGLLQWDIAKGKGLDDFVASEVGLDLEKQKAVLDRLIVDALPVDQFLKPAHVDLVASELSRIEMTQSRRHQLAKEWAKPLHTTAEALKGSKRESSTSLGGDVTGFMGADPEEPWVGKVDLAEVLWGMLDLFRLYVVMDEYKAVIRIFWDAFTWGYKDAFYLPLLVTTSPEPECGKTAAMEIDVALCRHSFRGASIPDGSIHRLVGTFYPTLFVDEAEAIAKDRPNTVAVLNAGYQHGTRIPRFNMETGLFELYDCACPKAVSGIGSFLGEATASRALINRMTRATHEELQKIRDIAFFDAMAQGVIDLRRQLLAWFTAHREEYGKLCRQIMLEMPEEIRARNKNSFSSLFAIAKLAGDWMPTLSDAALLLLEDKVRHTQVSLEHRLLMDCYLVITTHPELITLEVEKKPFIKTDDLIQQLHGLPETPWAVMPKSGKPLNSHTLFYLLKEYEIRSAKNSAKNARGIYIEHLLKQAEKFGNPPPPPSPPKNPSPQSPSGGPGGSPVSPSSEPDRTPGEGISPEFTEKEPAFTLHEASHASHVSPSQGENHLGEGTLGTLGTLHEGKKQSPFSENCPSFTGLTGKWERPQDTLAETAAYFSALLPVPDRWVAIDIETTAPIKLGKNKRPLKTKDALNPWIGQVRLIVICDGDQILQFDLFEQLQEKIAVLRTFATCGWIAHHAIFDLVYLKVHFGITPLVVFCTQIANAILTNGRLHHSVPDGEAKEIEVEVIKDGKPAGKKKKLKAASLNTLKRAVFDTLGVELPKELGGSNWGGSLSLEQLEYSRQDAIHLPPMATRHVHMLREAGLETVAMLEMALLPVVIDMKYRGFAVDREKVAKREKFYTELTEEKAELVRSLLGPGCPKLGDNRKSGGLRDRIQNVTGVRLRNMEYASLLAWEHPIGNALVAYKQYEKRLRVFQALLKHSERDGKIHATLNQMGAVTGRFSCREINLQLLENGPALFRDCMIASGSDRILVCADSKHVELRTACIFATAATGIRILMDIFLQGEKADPHKNTAANILDRPLEMVSKDDRQKAKAVNFGLLYGQNAAGLLEYAWNTYGVRLTLDEATLFRERHFNLYQDLKGWHQWAWDEIQNGPPTESRTILGRRHLIPPGTSQWNMFQALVNTPATGSAADLIKWQMVELARVLPPDCYLVLSVHDELICDCPFDRAQEVKALMERVMSATFDKLFDRVIPGPVDVSIGLNWEDAKP
jgi:DNA polymerase I-like protein with 3'-5' exonuclease and polymerase domains